jgi:hypothetical protein
MSEKAYLHLRRDLELIDQENQFADLIDGFENGQISELQFIALSMRAGIKTSRIRAVIHRIRMLDGVTS